MAVATAIVGKVDLNKGVELPAFTNIPVDGMLVPWNNGDHRMLLLLKNTGSAAGNVYVTKGNSIQAVAELVVTIPAGGIWVITPESGKFKQVTGDFKGNIMLSAGTATMQAVAIYTAG